MSVEPDNKMKYIKLAKNTVIASILITLSLSLLEIPKSYFGTPTGIADDETSDITFAKIEDKDCQNREVVNIDGKRYVITDSNKTIAALTDNEELHEAFGLYSSAKVVENVSYLRLFNDCQGFWKGYYADIAYYRDSDGFIFPSNFTYQDYINHKENNSFGRRNAIEKENKNSINSNCYCCNTCIIYRRTGICKIYVKSNGEWSRRNCTMEIQGK